MVSFRTLATAALAAFSVPAFAAVTPAEAVANIRTLTTKSQALQAPAQQINILNGPLIVIGQGPFPVCPEQSRHHLYPMLTAKQPIILGFGEIVTIATAAIAQMQGTPPVTSAVDAKAIADAFREVRCTCLSLLFANRFSLFVSTKSYLMSSSVKPASSLLFQLSAIRLLPSFAR